MFKVRDTDAFVKSQSTEIDGLHDAGVFEYLSADEVPNTSKLLYGWCDFHVWHVAINHVPHSSSFYDCDDYS